VSIKDLPIRVRPAVEGDVPFIFSSWLKSYRASLFAKQIGNTVFFSEHHKVIEGILETSTVLVLCDAEDVTNIYGYICAEKIDGIFVLHYVYIKHPYRTFGLAKFLLNQFNHETGSAAMTSHMTRIGGDLAPKYGFVYSPYLALTPEYETMRKKSLEKSKKKDLEEANAAVEE
jgi:hypothetical protein